MNGISGSLTSPRRTSSEQGMATTLSESLSVVSNTASSKARLASE